LSLSFLSSSSSPFSNCFNVSFTSKVLDVKPGIETSASDNLVLFSIFVLRNSIEFWASSWNGMRARQFSYDFKASSNLFSSSKLKKKGGGDMILQSTSIHTHIHHKYMNWLTELL
jgi:hypothetical protein